MAKTENGKSDTVRVTVKPTTKTFTVTITATCNGYNSVGNEWGKYFYVNNQQVSSGSRVSITMDRTTTIRTQIIEFDSINDVGTSTYSAEGYIIYGSLYGMFSRCYKLYDINILYNSQGL